MQTLAGHEASTGALRRRRDDYVIEQDDVE